MKYTTEYLFDVPRSHFEPALSILANEKIDTGRKLMKKLALKRKENRLDQGDVMRYIKAEESVNWWKGILHEPERTSDRGSVLGSVHNKKFRSSLSFMERKNRKDTNSSVNCGVQQVKESIDSNQEESYIRVGLHPIRVEALQRIQGN